MGPGHEWPSICMYLVVSRKQLGATYDMLRYCMVTFEGAALDHELRFNQWRECMEVMLKIAVYSKLIQVEPWQLGLCVHLIS